MNNLRFGISSSWGLDWLHKFTWNKYPAYNWIRVWNTEPIVVFYNSPPTVIVNKPSKVNECRALVGLITCETWRSDKCCAVDVERGLFPKICTRNKKRFALTAYLTRNKYPAHDWIRVWNTEPFMVFYNSPPTVIVNKPSKVNECRVLVGLITYKNLRMEKSCAVDVDRGFVPEDLY